MRPGNGIRESRLVEGFLGAGHGQELPRFLVHSNAGIFGLRQVDRQIDRASPRSRNICPGNGIQDFLGIFLETFMGTLPEAGRHGQADAKICCIIMFTRSRASLACAKLTGCPGDGIQGILRNSWKLSWSCFTGTGHGQEFPTFLVHTIAVDFSLRQMDRLPGEWE